MLFEIHITGKMNGIRWETQHYSPFDDNKQWLQSIQLDQQLKETDFYGNYPLDHKQDT